jgi:hypothetical protein
MRTTAAWTEAEILALTTAFLDRTLEKPRWRHNAHCLVTACLLLTRPGMDLERDLPDLIRRYNTATGVENTETAGYHHTITIFYIRTIRAFLATLPPSTGLEDACNAMLNSPIGDKTYVENHYQSDVLWSKKARQTWITPPGWEREPTGH